MGWCCRDGSRATLIGVRSAHPHIPGWGSAKFVSKGLPLSDHAFGDDLALLKEQETRRRKGGQTRCLLLQQQQETTPTILENRHCHGRATCRTAVPPSLTPTGSFLSFLPEQTFHFFFYETRCNDDNDGTEGHTSVVGDVAWHQQNPKLLGSVGDDRQLLFWDTSMDGSKPTTVIKDVRRK